MKKLPDFLSFSLLWSQYGAEPLNIQIYTGPPFVPFQNVVIWPFVSYVEYLFRSQDLNNHKKIFLHKTRYTFGLNKIIIDCEFKLKYGQHSPCFFNWSKIMSITMNVPVLPIPAEQCTRIAPGGWLLGNSWINDSCRLFTSWRKFRTHPGSDGTPWSGHACSIIKHTLN